MKTCLADFLRTQTRGRTGMDVTPLVFETSASTDSAIWATVSLNCGAKVSHFSDTHKFWKTFSLLKPEKILFEKRLSSPNRTGEFIRMK